MPGLSSVAPPSHVKVDPDDSKALLGYHGPYYNVEKLDGKVLVLLNTVRVGSSELWQATGMIRNQTCQTARIKVIGARLLGQGGKLLEEATATVSVYDLRPGEPAPFTIAARVPRAEVTDWRWYVEYEPSPAAPLRRLVLTVYEARVIEGARYSLFGSIRNEAAATAKSTRIVAAWLDRAGKVIHVAFPDLRLVADPSQLRSVLDLSAGDTEDFIYTTDDPALVALLGEGSVALWGISE